MSEMPTCTKCGARHWRFANCADAPAFAAKELERARERERLKVKPQFTAPPGYVAIGPNKFARADAQRSGLAGKPTHIQIAPGKYRRVDTR